jgi:hypothetical protein
VAAPLPVPWPAHWGLLLLPPLLAAGLYWQSRHYDHGLVDLRAPHSEAGIADIAASLPTTLLGRERVGKVRSFSRDTLYEYVNGHAEYYISAGFQGLAVAEYGADAQGQPSLVVNLWDMGKPLHAFGVLMDEAGPDAVALEGEGLGFRTGSGQSLAHGRYYLQLNAFNDDGNLTAAVEELRAAFGPVKDAGPAIAEFPAFGRVVATRFVKEAYRGLDLLSNVIERRFERDGTELEAFVIQGTAEKITDLERSVLAFLDTEGIGHETVPVAGHAVHRVSDPYEGDWFFFAATDRLVGAYAPLDAGLKDAVQGYLQGRASP